MNGHRLRSAAASRFAAVGLGAVLVALSTFAVWGAVRYDRSARSVDQASRISDDYSAARFAVGEEESLERKYRLEPGPAVRRRYDDAGRSLLDALQKVERHGGPGDKALVAQTLRIHHAYLGVINKMFAAVDAGDTPRVIMIDEGEVDPRFHAIERTINDAATRHRSAALSTLSALRRSQSTMLVATAVVFVVGLLLLFAFGWIIAAYRRAVDDQAEDSRHQALHDALTGLPNRSLFHKRATHAIEEAISDGTAAAIIVMDLDRFKEINETLGHHFGDRILEQVGGRLQSALRRSDLVARLGGDEFAVLLPDVGDLDQAFVLGEQLRDTLEPHFEVEGLSFHVEASLGLVLAPNHGTDVSDLLRHADVAMYAAKEHHLGIATYNPDHDVHSPERLALLSELRDAIKAEELVLHFQPKVDLALGNVVGVEALVRWQHPERGLLAPAAFLPLAERTGLIQPLTSFILDQALGQCRRWLDDGLRLPVAINFSARNLADREIDRVVAAALHRWEVPADMVVIEITETALISDPDRALQVLSGLHDVGVHIAVDDFGTGYSSLAFLRTLPVDELKIDCSFVTNMRSEMNDRIIVRSVVDLAHNLGLRAVAEGVEDQATYDELAEMGCDVAQGYHMARPMPAAAMRAWLSRWEATSRAASSLRPSPGQRGSPRESSVPG